MPPTTKNTMAATPYMMPSRLWSTVNTHDRHPVADDRPAEHAERGRRGDDVGAGGPVVVAGMGRSMMAMVWSSVPFSR